jgi:hypothetical protein
MTQVGMICALGGVKLGLEEACAGRVAARGPGLLAAVVTTG